MSTGSVNNNSIQPNTFEYGRVYPKRCHQCCFFLLCP